MAPAVGVSHAAPGRVINHGQLPSAQMIVSLARSGKVDPGWLLPGDGGEEPAARSEAARVFAPVSDRVLPGPPSGCPEVFGPLGLPTATPFLVRDAYWFGVPEDSPLVARKAEAVVPGDHLPIEAGPAWTTRSEAYSGRLVVLRHSDRVEGLPARVGATDFAAERLRFELDTFGEIPAAFIDVRSPPQREPPFAAGQPFYADDVAGVVLEKRTIYGRQE